MTSDLPASVGSEALNVVAAMMWNVLTGISVILLTTVSASSTIYVNMIHSIQPILQYCITVRGILTTTPMSLCRQELSSRLSSSNQEMTMHHLERQRSMVNSHRHPHQHGH